MNLEEKNKELQIEIENVRKEIKTDNFSMAIRELVQVYRDGDLELSPAYQRLFRWSDETKTKFIESILMGIPTPPIFIAQKKGSKWTIVDGLQRVSTILQLMKLIEVRDTEGNLKPPFRFKSAEKLPSIEDLDWLSLNEDAQRIIKMTKIDLKIILIEDNIEAQYELFTRLNTGSVSLQAQEIRNCLIIMLDENFYNKINDLKTMPEYRNCIDLTENKNEIEFPMELILRYFILKHNKINFSNYNLSSDLLSLFIDKETAKIIKDKTFVIEDEINVFKRVFVLLDEVLNKNTFRKFNAVKDEFEGPFLQTAFEAILPGLAKNIDYYEGQGKEILKPKIIQMYLEEDYINAAKRGNKALPRIQSMISFSNLYFSVNGDS
ncbi:MAG: DUF262 domain-containing protein [Candidatus Kapabacteria bacterium]|nr:DUF262 domain-containing protein [Candidatus Kapabacteria bacterium]